MDWPYLQVPLFQNRHVSGSVLGKRFGKSVPVSDWVTFECQTLPHLEKEKNEVKDNLNFNLLKQYDSKFYSFFLLFNRGKRLPVDSDTVKSTQFITSSSRQFPRVTGSQIGIFCTKEFNKTGISHKRIYFLLVSIVRIENNRAGKILLLLTIPCRQTFLTVEWIQFLIVTGASYAIQSPLSS